MISTDILVVIVAVYGAILSTYNFLIKFKERISKIKVKLGISLITHTQGNISDAQINISLHNHTTKPVVLNQPELFLPDGRKLILMNLQSESRFPNILEPGHSINSWNDLKSTAQSLKDEGFEGVIKIQAVVKDKLDKKYKSKKMKLNLNEWTSS